MQNAKSKLQTESKTQNAQGRAGWLAGSPIGYVPGSRIENARKFEVLKDGLAGSPMGWVPGSGLGWNPQIQNPKFRIQNPESRMQNAKCKMQKAKCKMQNAKSKI